MKERKSVVKAVANRPAVPRADYSPPRLREWGSLRELTRGGGTGTQDNPFAGTENT